MTVTSANPDDLGHFVTTAGRARTALAERLERLVSQQNAVLAACIDYTVPPNALSGAIQVFTALAQNERFVATVRTELLAADRDPQTGIATVSDASVAAALQAAGVARKPPPVEVEPGLLMGTPPTSGFVDDPICAANGNFVLVERDLGFPGWAAVLDVVRTYNSLAAGTVGAFGPGWSSALDLRIDHVDGGVLRARLADGSSVPFVGDGPELRAVGPRPLRVTVLDEGWLLHEGHTKIWRFDADGRFVGGVAGPATVLVERDDLDRIVALSELRSGRRVQVEWDGSRVGAVAASDGRVVSYRYDDDDLVGAERPIGAVAYGLDGHLIATLTDADGIVLARNVYDGGGRVVEQTNELGRTTRYEYSELGTTVVSDTVAGPRNAFTHDRRGNLTAMVDGLGRALRLTYDDAGRVTSVRDRTGSMTRYAFDDRGNLVERVDPDGLNATWAWDDADRLVREVDRAGGTTVYEYADDDRRPSAITGPDGATTRVTLLHGSVPAEIVDADGIRTDFEWDGDGQLVAVIDALGHRTEFAFDDAGDVVATVDGSGLTTLLRRNGAGRVVESVVADAVCEYRYTAAGRPTGGHDGEAVSWTASYGDHGRLREFADGVGSVVGFEWDPFGNLAAVIAPDGARYGHEYDAAGRLVAAVDPRGNRAEREVDGEGRVIAVTDAAGRTWRRDLDVLGRTVTSHAPGGATTTYRYHPDGTVAEVVHPDGARVATEVDAAGRVVAVIDALGGRFELRYSAAGRLVERRSPSGRVQRFAHDAAGRLVSVAGAAGDRFTLDLDGRGRVLRRSSEPRGTAVTYDYNSAGELIGVTGPTASTTAERDRSGRITAVADATGARSAFGWDGRGLLATATEPTGATAGFTRDVRGRLATTTAANGDVTAFDYDPTGFLRTRSEPIGTLTRLLDPTGVVTGLRHADGSGVDRTLDAAGRTASITSTDGHVLARYDRDAAGRIRAASRDDATTTFEWTANGRLAAIEGPAATVRIERDADGLVTGWIQDETTVSVERGAGGDVQALVDPVAGRVVPPARGDLVRDRVGRITGGAGGALHRYDAAGRLVETLDREGRRWRFGYGADGLLADEDGPLGARRYHRGALGRLERLDEDGAVTTYAYDGAGRRVRAARSDGSARRWSWDALGTLVAVEDVDAAGAVRRIDLALDAFGRPYRVDGDAVVWDAARTGRPLAVGAERFLHLEGRAAVATAAVSWADAPADPWGSDGIRRAHLGFRDELAVDDLVWMGERVYDARTREFLSPDPLLGVPGRPGHASAYAFGFFDPVNHLDPTGRRPISQQEFDAIREREEDGRFGQAWNAIKDDPWGTLAMVGVVAVGVGLMFVPGGQVLGAGILIGAASSAAVGVATGTFSPTDVAVGGVFGMIPGGSTYRTAIAVGAASGAGQELMMQTIRGDGYDWNMVAIQSVTGGATGAFGHRLTGARPNVDTPAPPTAPMPEPVRRPSFAVDAGGETHIMPPPGGAIDVEVRAPNPMKPQHATDAWEEFLGEGPYTNVNPRTGELDPDRVVSAGGTRSIRYGDHEMNGRPTRHHYHEETWNYDKSLDIWWVDNTMIRVPLR